MSTAEHDENPTLGTSIEREKEIDYQMEATTEDSVIESQPFLLTGWKLNALMSGLGLSMLLVGLVGKSPHFSNC